MENGSETQQSDIQPSDVQPSLTEKWQFIRKWKNNIMFTVKTETYTVRTLIKYINRFRNFDWGSLDLNDPEAVDKYVSENEAGLIDSFNHDGVSGSIIFEEMLEIDASECVGLVYPNSRFGPVQGTGIRNRVPVPRNLMMRSPRYLEKLIRENRFNDIEIPIEVTPNAIKAIEMILSGRLQSTKEYESVFKTVDDIYSYIRVFEYLKLKYQD